MSYNELFFTYFTDGYIALVLVINRLEAFYCATIAYHVGLNADLGWPQARPTSKKTDIYSWP